MAREQVFNLDDCTEFRQTLAARPPAIVHGTAVLLVTLLAAAVTWAALVQANLVVRATGRVRPVDIPARVFTTAGAEMKGRVAEVNFEEGDTVRRGEVLLRLDTAALDLQIAKLQRTIHAAEEELAGIQGLEVLLGGQLETARAKADAELQQARAELERERRRRESEVRQARAELAHAKDHEARTRKLKESRAGSQADWVEAVTKLRQAEERLRQAELPLSRGRLDVLRRAAELVERDFAVRLAELEARQVAKQAEADAAGKELATLELERQQAVLRAPIDGVVIAGQIDVGDVLEAGKAVVEIAPERGFRFEAAVPTEDAGHLQPGMPVKIKFDAYDYQKYGTLDGVVRFISPDSKLPEAHGNGGNGPAPAAYLVRIELTGDEVGRGELRGRVKLGLGGTAEIVTGRESLLAILLKKVRQTISLG